MKNSKNKWSLLFLNGIYSIFIMAGTLSGQGFTITPSEVLITTEFGASDTLMINLTSLPTSDVRIPVSVSDTTEGSVSVSEAVNGHMEMYRPRNTNNLSYLRCLGLCRDAEMQR